MYTYTYTYIYMYIHVYIRNGHTAYRSQLWRCRHSVLSSQPWVYNLPGKHDVRVTSRTHDTATHCNTLQHTATHCNTLQHTLPGKHDVRVTSRTQMTHVTHMNESCHVTHMNESCHVTHMNGSCHVTHMKESRLTWMERWAAGVEYHFQKN